MQIGVRVDGEPDFYPDHLEVTAVPPEGISVDLLGRAFTVHEVVLRVRPDRYVEGDYKTHYEIHLIPKINLT